MVAVDGVHDRQVTGVQAYALPLCAAASADPIYNGMDAADVSLANADNDAAGITVTPTAGLATTEAGEIGRASCRVRGQTTADVVTPVAKSNAAEGTACVTSITFTV